ncbi:hypothetical protein Q7C36_007285 [Tachysurus vachellii]|uniref:Uncharacterized protein n=1 Tax=Tachysurus vachellii TaxID=175792 RepID=A0AA88NBS1_TACVA|nr:hypothetical protein Q7C36_007285 [Tachysurus vachellii]
MEKEMVFTSYTNLMWMCKDLFNKQYMSEVLKFNSLSLSLSLSLSFFLSLSLSLSLSSYIYTLKVFQKKKASLLLYWTKDTWMQKISFYKMLL